MPNKAKGVKMSKIKILQYIFVLLLFTNKADAVLGGFINEVHSRLNKARNNVAKQVRLRANHVMGHVKKLRNRVKKRARIANKREDCQKNCMVT